MSKLHVVAHQDHKNKSRIWYLAAVPATGIWRCKILLAIKNPYSSYIHIPHSVNQRPQQNSSTETTMFASDDPFQRLTACGTFIRTFMIFAQRYDLFLIVSGFVLLPLAFVITVFQNMGYSMYTLMGGAMAQNTTTFNTDFDDALLSSFTAAPSSIFGEEGGGGTLPMSNLSWQFVLEYVIFFCFSLGGRAAMAYAVAELYAGRNPSWLDCCKKSFRRWCDLLLACVVFLVIVIGANVVVNILFVVCITTNNRIMVVLGSLMSMVWMVCYLFAILSVSLLAPVLMVEGTGPIHSLQRCWELSWNNRCYIYRTSFRLWIMYYVGQFLLYMILDASGGVDLVFSTLGAFIIMLPIWVYLPLVIITETVVYINIRVHREGLNKGVLEGELYGDRSITPTKPIYSLVERGEVEVV